MDCHHTPLVCWKLGKTMHYPLPGACLMPNFTLVAGKIFEISGPAYKNVSNSGTDPNLLLQYSVHSKTLGLRKRLILGWTRDRAGIDSAHHIRPHQRQAT
eukprot:scaffold1763_cov181-Amphora_coffeaeformis.AAC.10